MISRKGMTLLTYLFILVLSYFYGCEKSSPPDENELIHRMSVRFCAKVLEDPNSSERAKSLAIEILRKRVNGKTDPEPILVSAGLTQPIGRHMNVLVVGISDEDGDLFGIGVMEHHAKPDGETVVIEEEYPIFGYSSAKAANYYIFHVNIRKGDERKNEKEWKEYLEGGKWDAEHLPNLWISIPEPNKVDIEIWVYDHAGHKSNIVTLDNFMRSIQSK